MSEVRTPEEIVADLAPEYKSWKGSEKAKEKYKKEFFSSITIWLKENEEQAEKIVTINAVTPEQALEIAEKENPFWVAEAAQQTVREGTYAVILVENPEFQPFTIEYDGQVWGRQIASGSQLLDDKKLKEENPDLWIEITDISQREFITSIIKDVAEWTGTNIDDEQIEGIFDHYLETGKVSRVLRPLEDLEPDQLAIVQKYMYEGKPSVKLPAPKKADG